MSEPFLAEVRIVGFNFPPRGWAFCDGQILPINQNQSLYSLLGTTYGGDGRTSFALPDIRGRTPIHKDLSGGHQLGQKSGQETHTLSSAEMPAHNHSMKASTASGTLDVARNNLLARRANSYAAANNSKELNPSSMLHTGGGQAHENMQPYTTLAYCIALQGLFPSRN